MTGCEPQGPAAGAARPAEVRGPDRLRRPRLLVRTARLALRAYRRSRDLARILGQAPPDRPGAALAQLADLEAGMEAQRKGGLGGYQPSAHVAVLAALIAEAHAADPGTGIT